MRIIIIHPWPSMLVSAHYYSRHIHIPDRGIGPFLCPKCEISLSNATNFSKFFTLTAAAITNIIIYYNSNNPNPIFIPNHHFLITSLLLFL